MSLKFEQRSDDKNVYCLGTLCCHLHKLQLTSSIAEVVVVAGMVW